MSHQLSVPFNAPEKAIIDSLDFARQGVCIEGEVAVSAMGRLADVVIERGDRLFCRISGERDDDGQSSLVLQIEGELELLCQRCLQPLRWPLQAVSRLLLVAPGDAWPDEDLVDDDADAIAAEKSLSVLALMEEEVLLALPIAPRHTDCESPVASDGSSKLSPFAALAKLKKS